jgi:hypothetical protein
MAVHPSSSADVTRLLGELNSPDTLRRETAAARLAVIGPRAVSGLLGVAADTGAAPEVRVVALGALESLADPRAAPVCLDLAGGADEELAAAAVGVLATIARGAGARATAAFEALAALSLNRGASVERRLAAVAALEGFPARVLKPLYEALAKDPASRLVARVTRRQSDVMVPLNELVDGALPDDPALVGAIVREDGGGTSAPALRKLVDLVRTRERAAAEPARQHWVAVRGLAHQELGRRASRLALYDLRDTLEAIRAPLPVGFLAAAAAVGDASCLTPLAAAWIGAAAGDRWWRAHLAEAFQAIARRERITRRHPVIRKILARWPDAGTLVATARK